MIEQMFMPLDRHYDDGMSATGDAFKASAEKLIESSKEDRIAFMNCHLPICYLYRHAIELYLKAAILTVHRFFKLLSGEQPHQREPLIKIEGKWKPLHKTHSLKTLLGELHRMMDENMDKIKALTPTNWNTPKELIAWIDTIEACDGGSTYFRYPKSKGPFVDAEKSGCLPVDPAKLIAEMNKRQANGKPGKVVLAMKDDDNVIVEMFAMEDEPLAELREALAGAATTMSGCCTGLFMELVKGYGAKMFHWKAEAEAKAAAKEASRKKGKKESSKKKARQTKASTKKPTSSRKPPARSPRTQIAAAATRASPNSARTLNPGSVMR